MVNTMMRKRIFEIIEVAKEGDLFSAIYDFSMIALILLSVIPLCFKETPPMLETAELVCTIVFCIDYLLRWITADLKLQRGKRSFALYPVTPFAIIDLLSILPIFLTSYSGLRIFRMLRLLKSLRVLRVFRAFKFFRYSKQFDLVIRVIKKQRAPLLSVLILALAYILLSGLVMFTVEPDSFDSFFDALYWATTALTTVGYGDIYPISIAGRIVSMVSSLMGIAVVALPAGIVTGGYMEEINNQRGEE